MNIDDPLEHPERVVRLLAELVAIPSINVDPAESDGRNPEAAMVAFLTERLAALGCQVERRPVRAGRENLLARLPGIDRSRTLLLEAHCDTVGVEGMTVEPHRPRLVEGRMTGRGTCDAKGAMAAFLEALHRVAESGSPPPWDVLFVGAMGEETGCEGAFALAREGLRADAALVGEATFCRPLIAHKAAVWWELATEGVAAHGSSPHLGVNAIYRLGHVLRALEEEVPARLAAISDPLLGSPTLSCGMISGGEKVNVVPGRATVRLDSRILPEMDPSAHVQQVVAWLRESVGERAGPLHVGAVEVYPGLRLAPEHPFVQVCLAACREVLLAPTPGPSPPPLPPQSWGGLRGGGESEDVQPGGGSFFSDAGPLSQIGIPCVVFGPGDVGQAHRPDEYLDLEELLRCARITEKIIRGVG